MNSVKISVAVAATVLSLSAPALAKSHPAESANLKSHKNEGNDSDGKILGKQDPNLFFPVPGITKCPTPVEKFSAVPDAGSSAFLLCGALLGLASFGRFQRRKT
jgi:hypothetical protein